MSTYATGTRDFALLKVKFYCGEASINFWDFDRGQFCWFPDSYFIEVSVSTLQIIVRTYAVDFYSLQTTCAVGNTQWKTSVLVKSSLTLKRRVCTVVWIKRYFVICRFQITRAGQLSFSELVYLLINYRKRIRAQLCKTIYGLGITDHHFSFVPFVFFD